MSRSPKVFACCGSLRRESTNRKVLQFAMEGAIEAGGECCYFDLNDYPLPLYNQDDEERSGLPESALHLKELLISSDALLIASPEYNSGYSAALKNMIDWASRPATPGEEDLICFRGKVAAVMSASPGGLGGLRGLQQLRALLENMYVFVLPRQETLSSAYQAFDDAGGLSDKGKERAFFDLGKQLVEVTSKLQR